jgi:hypothetical protein
MSRTLLATAVAGLVLIGALQAQEGIRRGAVKAVDADKGRIVIAADGKEIQAEVGPGTRFMGADGKQLTDGLKSPSLKAGAAIMFKMADSSNQRLAGIKVIGAGGAAAAGERPMVDSSKLKPLSELGAGEYQGFQGGFYPGGKNERPAAHESAGLALAKDVRPLDANGQPDPNGRIVLLSVGMSNTSQASMGFQKALVTEPDRNPAVVFVNGAQGGQTAVKIMNPNDNGPGKNYWEVVDQRLKEAGVSRAQVEVAWIKQADARPTEGFPGYAKKLEDELTKLVQSMHERFPNLKLVYLTSRTYGGYAKSFLNPEPYAYESGFSVRWLIERQIKGEPELNFDAKRGTVRAPWLSWGPYFWANGSTKRGDGFFYEEADFANDGTHLSPSGMDKVGSLMLQFFKTDTTTRPWFVRSASAAK